MWRWDHPRSRGVYDRRDVGWRRTRGSSPLARGLLWAHIAPPNPQRIIPARAGFTPDWITSCGGATDHPRSRGVYHGKILSTPDNRGSSPLARGLPVPLNVSGISARIIPARAGFTCSGTVSRRSRWDHPRSRGVYDRDIQELTALRGSSPLARGLPLAKAAAMARRRIIPARAGFTSPTCTRPPRSTDHPRSRGVYLDEAQAVHSAFGSSPLARGLRGSGRKDRRPQGIIPARAGFTSAARRNKSPSGGSSPLARGLRDTRPVELELDRIIPARAGFTVNGNADAYSEADHPRSRGVYA